MTNTQAALALAGLEEVEESLKHKQEMVGWYNQGLKDVKGLTLPKTADYNNIHSYWMYSVIVEDSFSMPCSEITHQLKEKYQIDTRPFFYPINEQPALAKYFKDDKTCYPVSKELSEKGFYLPSGLTLTKDQATVVCSAIKSIRNI